MNEKKNNGFGRFLKNLFTHNWDLKLGAIGLGFLLWVLIVLAV